MFKTRLFSSAFVFTFFTILFSIGLAPINDAYANEGTTITEVASLEHDLGLGYYNSLVQVDSDTYALAYAGTGGDGFISTFTISADGSTVTEVATLEHDTDNGTFNSLVQVDSDTYALAYTSTGQDGFISTFDIAADGTTITEVATLEHDTLHGRYNSLVQVDSDTYALAYAGNDTDLNFSGNGFISTFDIAVDGTITAVRTQSLANNLEHDTVQGYDNSLVQVDSDTYALAYAGSDYDGFISTFTISSSGVITAVRTQSLGNNLEHDTDDDRYNSLVQVDSDTYALAYTGPNTDGFISTFDIAADGTTITEVATLEHDTEQGEYNSLVQVDSDTYALAYAGNDADGNGRGNGFISTFDIAADGTTITEVVTLEHDTVQAEFNSLVQVDSDTYALAYAGDSTDGFISTFTIDTFVAAVEENKKSSDCYDCIPPTLQKAHITISSNEQIIMPSKDGNYNTYDTLHITANVGDKVTILLNVTDNKPVDDFRFAGLYTNYQDKPSDMNTYYANNYDNLKQVSTSFYEWNVRSDDIAYSHDATLSWSQSDPEIIIEELNEDNFKFKNDENNMVQYFMMPFTFTINEHMDSTKIVAKVHDGAYNRLHVTLPVVLDVSGNDPLNFKNLGKQKVLGFFDEAVLIQSISDWDDSQDNTEKLAQLL